MRPILSLIVFFALAFAVTGCLKPREEPVDPAAHRAELERHFVDHWTTRLSAPSRSVWQEFMTAAQAWPHRPFSDGAIARLDEALEAWDVELRRVPSHWQWTVRPEHDDLWQLVRHLDLRATGVPEITGENQDLDHLSDVAFVSVRGGESLRRLIGSFDRWLPSLRGLRLEQIGPGELDELLAWERAEDLERLILWNNGLGAEATARLAASPALSNLRHLDLGANALGDAGAIALSASTALRNLRELHLDWNGIGPQGARALAAARFDRLEALRLAYDAIGEEGALALAEASYLPGLRLLDLERNGVTDAALDALLTERRGHQLESLLLSFNQIGARGAQTIAQAELPALKVLELRSNAVGDEGVVALAQAELEELRFLDVSRNEITAQGAAAIAESSTLSRLENLALDANPIGAEGAQSIARSERLRLVGLSVDGCGLSDAGLAELARAPWASQLQFASVESNGLSDEAMARWIAQIANPRLHTVKIGWNGVGELSLEALGTEELAGLRELSLEGTELSPDQLQRLLQMPFVRRLDELDLAYCGLEDEAAQILTQADTLHGLREIDLEGNQFSPEGIAHLAEAPSLPAHVRARWRERLPDASREKEAPRPEAAAP